MNAAGQHARAEGPGPKRVEPLELSVQWQDYDRIAPGVYPAYVRSARTYRDPQYKRWTCLLRFDVLNETLTRTIAHVPFWLNLGDYDRPMQAGAVGILLSGATLMGAPRDAATGFQIVYFADV